MKDSNIRWQGTDTDTDKDTGLSLLFDVLDAIDVAIANATSPQHLYESVCEAALKSGGFLLTSLITFPPGAVWVSFQAVCGVDAEAFAKLRVCADERRVEGRGVVGTAFRSGATCFTNDFCSDGRTRPWHEAAGKIGINACAALPVSVHGQIAAVLVVCSGVRAAFAQSGLALLERIAQKMGRALSCFKADVRPPGPARVLLEDGGRYRTIVETMEDAYYEVDMAGNVVFANSALPTMLGYTLGEMIGANNRIFMTEQGAATVFSAFSEVYRTGMPKRTQDWEHVHKNGSLVNVEGSVQLARGPDGIPIGFRGILRDVTARRKIEQELRESEMRFRALTNLSSDWYWEQDAEFRYTRMESRHKNLDSTQASFLGKRPWESDLDIQAEGGWCAHRATLAANGSFRDVIMHRVLAGQKPYYISVSGEPIIDDKGAAIGYRGVSREITDQRIAEQRIRHLATHDSLTDLPNRMMFSQLLQAALASGQRYSQKFAVLFLDLDRFKFINDSLGHDAGDKLLQEIAIRLKCQIGDGDTIARMGGDEFVVLVREIDNVEQVGCIARKLLLAATESFVLANQECNVTASIGIAMYPAHGEDEQMLMKRADIAMYFAKDQGKNNFQFYAGDIEGRPHERLSLESNLRHALAQNELTLHYQPKLDLADGRITGTEALLRWNSPTLGPIAPDEFIPIAEEIGLIVPIGKWVLQTACAQNVEWQRQGFAPLCMAVNLSVRQFGDENLLSDIAAVLEQTGMRPELLELEITEGMVIHNPDRVLMLMAAIKDMGVRLAIDDFGTGYSSLGQLKNFPLDTLKVDRSFINDIPGSEGAKAITEATILMGKAMKLTVVAEGVETAEQAEFLRLHSCDEMQGYYFSKAVSAEAFAVLLRRHVSETALKTTV